MRPYCDMPDFAAPAPVASACPICQCRLGDDDLFCSRCGVFLKSDGSNTEAVNLPVVHLLAQVCALQRDLLRQFRQGQAVQARQFQRALQVQSEQLEKTLAHVASQTETTEQRVAIWQRWTAGFAAAVVAVVVVAVRVVA